MHQVQCDLCGRRFMVDETGAGTCPSCGFAVTPPLFQTQDEAGAEAAPVALHSAPADAATPVPLTPATQPPSALPDALEPASQTVQPAPSAAPPPAAIDAPAPLAPAAAPAVPPTPQPPIPQPPAPPRRSRNPWSRVAIIVVIVVLLVVAALVVSVLMVKMTLPRIMLLPVQTTGLVPAQCAGLQAMLASGTLLM